MRIEMSGRDPIHQEYPPCSFCGQRNLRPDMGAGAPLSVVTPVTSLAVTPAEIVGLLAEPARLRVVAALVLGARTPADVGATTGLAPARSGGRCRSCRQAGSWMTSSR